MTDQEAKSLLLEQLSPEQLEAHYQEVARAIKEAYKRGFKEGQEEINERYPVLGWVSVSERQPEAFYANRVVPVLQLVDDGTNRYWLERHIKISKLLRGIQRYAYWFDKEIFALPAIPTPLID